MVLYNQAIDALQNANNHVMNIGINKTITVDGMTYLENSKQTVTYVDYGKDSFRASMLETVDQDGYLTVYYEQFQDNTLFVTLDSQYYFQGEMSADAFTARLTPIVMLDATLYEDISVENEKILFTNASAGETWIVPEHATLVNAKGSMLLDDDGKASSAEYDVTYSMGGIEIRYVISVIYYSADNAAVEEIKNPDTYTTLEYVDAPRITQTACGYLMQAYDAHALTTNIAESVYSQAGSVIRNQVTTINSWGSGKDYTAEVDLSIFMMTVNGEDSYEQNERFENGVYSMSQNGGDHIKNTSVKSDAFQNYVVQSLLANLPDDKYLTNATAEDLGTLIYLDLTYSDDLPNGICQSICEQFWGDSDFLNNLASSYETETMEFYFSVDKFTGLPTAIGYSYAGNHTIEGFSYPLTKQLDQSFDLCSVDAYKTLTDDVLTPAEPDEKATPLFYHVTGENGEEMWLFGTIHVGDNRTSYLPQKIYDAFDAADALAVEFNSEAFDEEMENNEELSEQVSNSYFYDDGTTTADHIEDEELYEYALKLLKATGNYNMNMPYAKAYLWSSSIENFLLAQFHPLSSQQGVDNQLIWRAQDQEKPIYDVESGLFQTQMLTGFSDALQEQLLLESAGMDPLEYVAGTQELFEMWCAGDEEALAAYLNEEEDLSDLTPEEIALIEEYNDAMGTDRNDDMLDVAIGYLESGEVVFYAVGLAHLLAEDGLVNTLRDAGYTVELVTFE